MKMRIENNDCRNAGLDGIYISGFTEGDFVISGNNVSGAGRRGIGIYATSPLMEQIGLPDDTPPREFFELLQILQGVSEQQREQSVQSSSLLQRWAARGLNATSLGANIVTIAGAPYLPQLLALLSKAI